ncbi:MAG: glycosyltransferase family 39 protein [Candidatus Omnitrophota bacterium]
MLILFVGAFFAFAPAWVPHIQQVWGRNTFVAVDSMVLLGVTLLTSLLAYYLLPDFLVSDLKLRVPSPESQVSNSVPRTLPMGYKLIAIGALLSLVFILYRINQRILHSFLSSADEHSCYFLAECLRKGKLYVDMPSLADFFKVTHVGMRSGKWFSVYPPGWPLIWAFGLQFKIVDWLNPVMSVLAVFFFYLAGIRLFSRWSVVCGLILMCLSPFFMFTSASYFSHSTCLLCISVFLYAFLKWREAYVAGKDPVGWASLCALAVGYGLMTRYLTMAAVAGPFLLYHYLPIFFDWKGWSSVPRWRGEGWENTWLRFLPFRFKRPQLRKSDWIVAGIIAAFMILILYQNYLVTGKAFRAPNKHDKSWERLGFRRDYTPLDALFYLIARVFFLMDWFAPAIVGAYLYLLARDLPVILRSLRKTGQTQDDGKSEILRQLFRLSMVFIALAYFFYYSWGGNQWGPRYLWEGMPFLCIAVADWMVCRWKSGGVRVRKFLPVFFVASLVTSGILFVKHAEFTEEASRQRKAFYDLAEQTIKEPALVFIQGFLGHRLVFAEEDAIRNSPFLDGRILYVHDLGDRNKELMVAYPDRACYRGTYDRKKLQPRLEKIH